MRVFSVLIAFSLLIIIAPAAGFSGDLNADAKQYLQGLETQVKKQERAFTGFDAERGKRIFFEERSNEKTGKISCATCHTSDLKKDGKTLVGKPIDPLAPSVNQKRLINAKEIEKWLLRNFKQVYGREGTAKEKGDVLMFIKSQ